VRPQKSSSASDEYLFNFFLQIKKRQKQALLLLTQAIYLIGSGPQLTSFSYYLLLYAEFKNLYGLASQIIF
jgi:hypothetical protein